MECECIEACVMSTAQTNSLFWLFSPRYFYFARHHHQCVLMFLQSPGIYIHIQILYYVGCGSVWHLPMNGVVEVVFGMHTAAIWIFFRALNKLLIWQRYLSHRFFISNRSELLCAYNAAKWIYMHLIVRHWIIQNKYMLCYYGPMISNRRGSGDKVCIHCAEGRIGSASAVLW